MNIKRAQAIINSPNEIEVRYNGESVWIESVNELNEKAEIKDHKTSKVKRHVAVEDLVEIGIKN